MKKLILATAFLIGSMSQAFAFQTEWTYKDYFTLVLPGSTFSPCVLYDFVGKESLIGGETDIIRFPKEENLSLTIGAVGDLSGSNESELNGEDRRYFTGTPFIGAKYDLEELNIKDLLHFGVFYGRNLDEGRNLLGIKSSLKFW